MNNLDDQETVAPRANVYLAGDPQPVMTSLAPDEVLEKLRQAREAAEAGDLLDDYFVRLPGELGDSLVRPRAIVAILPSDEDEDGDE